MKFCHKNKVNLLLGATDSFHPSSISCNFACNISLHFVLHSGFTPSQSGLRFPVFSVVELILELIKVVEPAFNRHASGRTFQNSHLEERDKLLSDTIDYINTNKLYGTYLSFLLHSCAHSHHFHSCPLGDSEASMCLISSSTLNQ